MNIEQGDQFEVQGGGTIRVTHSDVNKVQYKHIHGSTKSGEVSRDVFRQFTENGYFKAVAK